MLNRSKDKLYDEFLKEPTKDHFREFLKNNYGELDEVDFKEAWIEKGHLAKTILAMANSGGGLIIFGVKESDSGSLSPNGLDSFEDKAEINNGISKLISPGLDYEILDYSYESSEYEAVQNKKFQLLIVHDTPERLPFISLNETTDLLKDTIYVRRGTKCERATSDEIERIITRKIENLYKDTSDLSLDEHLAQLKKLYKELPKNISVLVRKGEPNPISVAFTRLFESSRSVFGTPDEYEEIENPDYPEESYEAFILRMIERKKIKIEKVLDLK